MKNQRNNKLAIATKTLVYGALFAALAAVLGQLLAVRPTESMKFTLDKFVLFLSGMFFGPLVGGMVGFVADFVGGTFLGRGFTLWLCVPAVLYGVCGGLFRRFLAKNFTVPRLTIAYLWPTVIGGVLIQSVALAWTYNAANFLQALGTNLISRSIQFTIMLVLEVTIIFLLVKTGLFTRLGVWPPVKKGDNNHDC